MLISPPICKLEKLLHICEKELCWLDMAINFKNAVYALVAVVMFMLQIYEV